LKIASPKNRKLTQEFKDYLTIVYYTVSKRNRVMAFNTTFNNISVISWWQGSPHLQQTGKLDFSLRGHEGEVKTCQGDFQQLHIDIFLQKCVVSLHH
jgi:hypothetical protein